MGSSSEQYCLRWNDYHTSLTQCFRDLRDDEEMLDVSIVSDGRTVKAHKLVLSACSPMFKAMLRKSTTRHPLAQPIVFLHGVRYADITAILDFMYNGEVNICHEDLRTFLAVAEDLKVRGLSQAELAQDRRGRKSNMKMNDHKVRRERSRSPRSPGSPCHEEVKKPPIDQPPQPPSQPLPQPPLPEFHDDSSGPPSDHGRAMSMPGDVPVSPAHYGDQPLPYPLTGEGRRHSLMDSPGNDDQVSFHRLGGRDSHDPLSCIMVARSPKGWHCPECLHVSTTKGNLKSHILSGRHKLFEKSFKCRFCDRTYSTRQSMQVHISTNHRYDRDREMKEYPGSSPSYPMVDSALTQQQQQQEQPEVQHQQQHINPEPYGSLTSNYSMGAPSQQQQQQQQQQLQEQQQMQPPVQSPYSNMPHDHYEVNSGGESSSVGSYSATTHCAKDEEYK